MKDKKTGRCFLRVDLTDDLHEAVQALSRGSGVPASVVMRRALEAWVATGVVPARVAGKPDEGHAGT